MEKKAIIMFGAPGSGKGTQGEILAKKTKYKYYTLSSLIKIEIEKMKNKSLDINSGLLVDDMKIFDIFRKYFKFEKNVILDGIPRTLNQAIWLYGFLTKSNYKIIFLNIKVDEKELIERIKNRAKIQKRLDDKISIFKNRLKIFENEKKEILEFYKKEIIEFNGNLEVEKISQKILEKIKN